MFVFGAGDLFAVPLIDASGNAIPNPTPIRVLTMQEMSLDFSGDIKELYGQNQFAVAVARGKVKLSGKVKGATITGQALNTLYFGQSMTTGVQQDVAVDNIGTVLTGTGVTPTVPNGGTFIADMGVVSGAQVPFVNSGASAPTSGQYQVSPSGVYTFNAGDNGTTVFISYQYSATVPNAKRIQVANLTMGQTPFFKALFRNQYAGKKALTTVYSAVASKLMFLATKLDDFNIPEFEFTGQQDPQGRVADIYVQE